MCGTGKVPALLEAMGKSLAFESPQRPEKQTEADVVRPCPSLLIISLGSRE